MNNEAIVLGVIKSSVINKRFERRECSKLAKKAGVTTPAMRAVLNARGDGLLALEKELEKAHGCRVYVGYMVDCKTNKAFVSFYWH